MVNAGNLILIFDFLIFSAHWRRKWRRRSSLIGSRILPSGLPNNTFYRMQRRKGSLPLLRHTDQLLARHRRRSATIYATAARYPQGGSTANARFAMPSVYKKLIFCIESSMEVKAVNLQFFYHVLAFHIAIRRIYTKKSKMNVRDNRNFAISIV